MGSIVVPFWDFGIIPCRILNISHKKALLWSLWVGTLDPLGYRIGPLTLNPTLIP